MHTLQQRAIYIGKLGREPPFALLDRFHGTDRVEVFLDRASGKRGAVVISFGDPGLCKAAIEDGSNQLQRAYSVRSRGRGKTMRSWDKQRKVEFAPSEMGMQGHRLDEAALIAGVEVRLAGDMDGLVNRMLGGLDIQGILERTIGRARHTRARCRL